RAKARIKSPSRMTRVIAEFMGEGIVDGLLRTLKPIINAAGGIVGGIEGALSPSQSLGAALSSAVGNAVVGSLNDALTETLSRGQGIGRIDPQYANTRAINQTTTNNTYHVTINNTVQVDDLDELNDAVEFVRDLDRERELIFTGSF